MNSEEQENIRDLTLKTGTKALKGKEVEEATNAMKELGWSTPGVKVDPTGKVHIAVDSKKALARIILQMEEAEVGMSNVYKECLYSVMANATYTN